MTDYRDEDAPNYRIVGQCCSTCLYGEWSRTEQFGCGRYIHPKAMHTLEVYRHTDPEGICDDWTDGE